MPFVERVEPRIKMHPKEYKVIGEIVGQKSEKAV